MTVQVPTDDSVPMLNPTFSGAVSPSDVMVAVTSPVAPVKTLCVWAPLTVSLPVNVSVTVTGSGVVGMLTISPSQPAAPMAANSTSARRIDALIRKWIPLRT